MVPGRQQHGRRRRRLPEADRGDVVADELHRVVDREQRRDVATGAVDVDVDVLVGVLRLEVDQLGADQAGDLVVDRRLQEDDVLLEQPAVEVVGPLAAAGLLDDVGDEVVAGSSCGGFRASRGCRRSSRAAVARVVVVVVASSWSWSWSWPPSSSWVWPRIDVAVERVAVGVDDLDVVEQPVEGLATCGSGPPARARGRCARRPCGPGWPSGRTASPSARTRRRGRRRRPRAPSAAATARSARSTLTACSDCALHALDERGRRPGR